MKEKYNRRKLEEEIALLSALQTGRNYQTNPLTVVEYLALENASLYSVDAALILADISRQKAQKRMEKLLDLNPSGEIVLYELDKNKKESNNRIAILQNIFYPERDYIKNPLSVDERYVLRNATSQECEIAYNKLYGNKSLDNSIITTKNNKTLDDIIKMLLESKTTEFDNPTEKPVYIETSAKAEGDIVETGVAAAAKLDVFEKFDRWIDGIVETVKNTFVKK